MELQNQTDKIDSERFNTIKAIGLILLSVMYLLSYKYQIIFGGINILSALPVIVAINIFVEKIVIYLKGYLKNKILFFSMYILLFLSAVIAMKFNDIVLGIGIITSLSSIRYIK